jgi:hypothetical protein
MSLDPSIVIAKNNVADAIAALQRAAGIDTNTRVAAMADGGRSEPLMLPKPEPMSGAERQRRYRNRHRNENGDADRHESDKLPLRTVTETEEAQLPLIAAE